MVSASLAPPTSDVDLQPLKQSVDQELVCMHLHVIHITTLVAVGGSSCRLQEETKQEESRAGVNGLVNVSRMKAREQEGEGSRMR